MGKVTRMTAIDENLFLFINNGLASPALDLFFYVITSTGWAPAAGLLCVAGAYLLGPAPKWRAVALALAAMLATGAVPTIIKQLYVKDRPLAHFAQRMEKGEVKVHVVGERLYHRSFPSGHTQAAFTAAVFVALMGRGWPLRGAVLGWAAMVGLSRIYVGAHFPSDTLAGALIGSLGAWIFIRLGGVNREPIE